MDNRHTYDLLMKFAAAYRADAAVRARVDSGDYSDLELELPQGIEVRVLQNTADTLYFPLPSDPNALVSDEVLAGVSGGNTISTASTIPSCLGTANCHEYVHGGTATASGRGGSG